MGVKLFTPISRFCQVGEDGGFRRKYYPMLDRFL